MEVRQPSPGKPGRADSLGPSPGFVWALTRVRKAHPPSPTNCVGEGVYPRLRREGGGWSRPSTPLPDPPPQTAWGREMARESAVSERSSPPLPYRAGTRGCRQVVYGRGGRGVRAPPEDGGPVPLPLQLREGCAPAGPRTRSGRHSSIVPAAEGHARNGSAKVRKCESARVRECESARVRVATDFAVCTPKSVNPADHEASASNPKCCVSRTHRYVQPRGKNGRPAVCPAGTHARARQLHED
jgi:hypothetical protein